MKKFSLTVHIIQKGLKPLALMRTFHKYLYWPNQARNERVYSVRMDGQTNRRTDRCLDKHNFQKMYGI